MFRRILVGVAGTPATEAKIAYTVELAARHGAAVSAMSVVDVERLAKVGPVPIGGAHYAKQMRDDRVAKIRQTAQGALERFEAACADAGVPFSVIRAEKDPFDALADAWRYHDLCVLGLRGWFHNGVVAEPENALLRLVDRGVRPILAITEGHRPIDVTMIAYDGTAESAKAMKRFMQLNLWPDCRLHIVYFGSGSAENHRAVDSAADYVRTYGAEATTAVIDAPVLEGIPAEADKVGADLLVLGTHYRKAMLGKKFGATIVATLKTSERPVFMTH